MERCFKDQQSIIEWYFSKLDGSCGIKNIITDSDILNLGGLHVDDISTKNTAESRKKLYQSIKAMKENIPYIYKPITSEDLC